MGFRTRIIEELDLAKTYQSGQVFSWELIEGVYIVPIGSTLYELKQVDGSRVEALLLTNEEEGQDEAFETYFDLKRDYRRIYDEIALSHKELAEAVERARGIRLLKQDEDEMLLTFILSQNNHIGRIKKSMAGLKELYGAKIGSYKGRDFYSLPAYETLLSLIEKDFVNLGAGYRAPYLVAAIKDLPDLHDFLSRGKPPTEALLERLLEVRGVGPKVAACIALFGHGDWDVFPVDTWVKKALQHYYGPEGTKPAFIHSKKREFEPYSSLVQQLMFYHMREKDKDERRTKNQ